MTSHLHRCINTHRPLPLVHCTIPASRLPIAPLPLEHYINAHGPIPPVAAYSTYSSQPPSSAAVVPSQPHGRALSMPLDRATPARATQSPARNSSSESDTLYVTPRIVAKRRDSVLFGIVMAPVVAVVIFAILVVEHFRALNR